MEARRQFEFLQPHRRSRGTTFQIGESVSDAVDNGSTGTEILMTGRWKLVELLKTKPEFPVDIVARIKDDAIAANELFS